MAFARDGYYYQQQLKTYILQFMAIFTGLQVQIGKWNTEDERLISVPIHYATPDRVVAAIFNDNTHNKPMRLPLMSASFRAINRSESFVGTGFERRNGFVPTGGLVPDDIQVIYQRRPTPYMLDMELGLFASNSDQHFQMLEQILPLFDPVLQIQTSDAPFDMKRITTVELTGIQNDSNDPIGTDRRIVKSILQFKMPIWLDTPADVRRNFVEKIYMRVGAVSTTSTDEFEIIGDLDGQGIQYTLVEDGSGLNL